MGAKKGNIEKALDVLSRLNVPGQQQNERSALALLTLLSLKEGDSWKKAKKGYIRIHDMMQFIKASYGKEYQENSRESFRRQTLHQFEKEIGIVERNADEMDRPTNSPNTTWSITEDALKLFQSYGTKSWKEELQKFLDRSEKSLAFCRRRNNKHKLSLEIEGKKLKLSPGKHNRLQINILCDFRENFCKGAKVVYFGDTAHKMLYLNKEILEKHKFEIKKHDILPDIVLLDEAKKRLYLIEAVSAHGPVSNKRKIELTDYFSQLGYKLVFVSAFPDFREFKRHIEEIAWETEVWVSEMPNHMIHFNGDKFLKLD